MLPQELSVPISLGAPLSCPLARPISGRYSWTIVARGSIGSGVSAARRGSLRQRGEAEIYEPTECMVSCVCLVRGLGISFHAVHFFSISADSHAGVPTRDDGQFPCDELVPEGLAALAAPSSVSDECSGADALWGTLQAHLRHTRRLNVVLHSCSLDSPFLAVLRSHAPSRRSTALSLRLGGAPHASLGLRPDRGPGHGMSEVNL